MAENLAKVQDAKAAITKSHKMLKVDLVNPTHGGRSIDRCNPTHDHVYVPAGETVRDVEVAEWVIKELQARNRAKANSDLRVYEAGKAPAPKSETAPDADENADDAD